MYNLFVLNYFPLPKYFYVSPFSKSLSPFPFPSLYPLIFIPLLSSFLFSVSLFFVFSRQFLPTLSLDVYDGISFSVSTCYHPMMNTLHLFNRFTCGVFVKKSGSINYVVQYYMLNLSFTTLPLKKNI